MKRVNLLVLLMVIVLAVPVGLFGAEKNVDISKLKTAVMMPSLAGQIYVGITYGFIDNAKKAGVKTPTVVLAAGGYDKLEVQVKQMEDMIASGMDAIAIMPISQDGMAPVTDKAVNAGIKVIEVGNVTSSTKVQARLRSDQLTIGKKAALAIASKLKGKGGNVVMFNGPAGASWSLLQTEGFMSVMKDYPEIKIIAQKWLIFDPGVSMNTMNDLLQAFPKIDFVYCAGEAYVEGVRSSLKTAGRRGQEISVVTVTLSSAVLNGLKDGSVYYCVGNPPVNEGRMTFDVLLKMVKGETVPPMTYTTLFDYYSDKIKSGETKIDMNNEFYPTGWTVPK
jgi:ABC-type sugar transport system substrate-binding protein